MRISEWSFDGINWEEIPYMIQSPEHSTATGVVFIWGWSGDKVKNYYEKKDRWNFLAHKLTGEWYNLVRFQWWNSKEEFHDTNLAAMHQNIRQCVDILSETCRRIVLVWKSAGWAATITYLPTDDRVEWAVVWAPATEVSGNAKDIEETLRTPFQSMRTQQKWYREAVRVLLTPDYLNKIKVPVWIVHAQDDDVIPLENSEDIMQYLPEGSILKILNGWKHSYKDEKSNVDVAFDTSHFIKDYIFKEGGMNSRY